MMNAAMTGTANANTTQKFGPPSPFIMFQPFNMVSFFGTFSPIILIILVLSYSLFYQNVKGLVYLGFLLGSTLVRSVILQAMLDATKPKTPRESTEAIIARETAMSWFFCSVGVTADDFMTVCDIADVDPDYVRSFAHKVIRSKEVDFVRKRINTVLTFN